MNELYVQEPLEVARQVHAVHAEVLRHSSPVTQDNVLDESVKLLLPSEPPRSTSMDDSLSQKG